MKAAAATWRFLGAAMILTAVIAQGVTTVGFFASTGKGDDPQLHGLINFVSFFTIDSNTLAAAVLIIGGVIAARGTTRDPRWYGLARVSVVTYMTITGIVYNLLLRGIELPQGRTLDWANEVLHLLGPALLLLDWLLAPGRIRLQYRHVAVVAAFPLVWVAYSMIRGPFAVDPGLGTTPYYPYPFLDPATGYVSVAIYILAIAIIICAIATGLIWISRHPRWPLPLDADRRGGAVEDEGTRQREASVR